LKSQIVTSSWGGMRRAHPYAFTEQGVAMLSSVLRSNRAVQVNIAIMRTFVKLREILTNNALLREKIESLERKYDGQFKKVFSLINLMLEEKARPKAPIGYLSEARGRRKRAKKAGTKR